MQDTTAAKIPGDDDPAVAAFTRHVVGSVYLLLLPTLFRYEAIDELTDNLQYFQYNLSGPDEDDNLRTLAKAVAESEAVRNATEEAQKVLMDPKTAPILQRHICPLLQSLTGDVFEIAKSVTPALLTLSITGVITMPLHPLVYAGVVLWLWRGGIAVLCPPPTKKDQR
jgi:hypothetical protein